MPGPSNHSKPTEEAKIDLSQFSIIQVERLNIYVETKEVGEYIIREFPDDDYDDSINYVDGIHSLLIFSQQLIENGHLTIAAFNTETLPSGDGCEVLTKSKDCLEIHLAITQENVATLHARLAYCMAKVCFEFGNPSNKKLNPFKKLHQNELLNELKRAYDKYRRSTNSENTEKTAIAKLIFGSLHEKPQELTQEGICRAVQALTLSSDICSVIAPSYIEALTAYIEKEVSLKENLLVECEEEIKPLDEQQQRERHELLEDSNFETDTFKKIEIKGIIFWAENDSVIERLTEIFSMEEWLNSELLSKVVKYTRWLSSEGLAIKAYDSTDVKHFDAAPELGGVLDQLAKSTALYHARFRHDGVSQVIKIPTRDMHTLFESFIHEATHLCLALAKSTTLISDQEKNHINHMIRMLYKDYRAYKILPKRKRLKHESYVAQKIFHMPLRYSKDDFFVELMAFSMQAIAVSETTFKRIAPHYYEAFKSYVNDELDSKLKLLDIFSKYASEEIDDEDSAIDPTEDALTSQSLAEEKDTLFDGASKAGESTSQPSAEENNALFDSVSEEEIIAGITVDYSQSSLKGGTVYHGTINAHIDSIKAGPQNIGRGFGGAGLYVFLGDDRARAEEYAGFAGHAGGEKVVIEGQLNPNKDYKIARIQIVPRYQTSQVDYKKGLFPADWKNNTKLQSLIHKHFDVLEVCADTDENSDSYVGYNMPSNRFLVIHERAGKDIINWSHTHPVRNTAVGSSTPSSTSASIPSEPTAKPKLPGSSSTMQRLLPAGSNNIGVPQAEHAYAYARRHNPEQAQAKRAELAAKASQPSKPMHFIDEDDYELPEFPTQQQVSQEQTGKSIGGKTGTGVHPDTLAGPSLPISTPNPSTSAQPKALLDLTSKKPALPAPPVRKGLPYLPGTSAASVPPVMPKPDISWAPKKTHAVAVYVNDKPIQAEWAESDWEYYHPSKQIQRLPQDSVKYELAWDRLFKALGKYVLVPGVKIYGFYQCYQAAYEYHKPIGENYDKPTQHMFALGTGTALYVGHAAFWKTILKLAPAPIGGLLVFSSLLAHSPLNQDEAFEAVRQAIGREDFEPLTELQADEHLIQTGEAFKLTQAAKERLGLFTPQAYEDYQANGFIAMGEAVNQLTDLCVTKPIIGAVDFITPIILDGTSDSFTKEHFRASDFEDLMPEQEEQNLILYGNPWGPRGGLTQESFAKLGPDALKIVHDGGAHVAAIGQALKLEEKKTHPTLEDGTSHASHASKAETSAVPDTSKPPFRPKPSISFASTEESQFGYVNGRRTLLEGAVDPAIEQRLKDQLAPSAGGENPTYPSYLRKDNHGLGTSFPQVGSSSTAAKDYLAIANLLALGQQLRAYGHQQKETADIPHSIAESNHTHGAPSSDEKLHEATHQNNTVKPDEVTFHKTGGTASTHQGIKEFAHQNFDPKQSVYGKLPPIGGYRPEMPLSPVILTVAGGTGIPLTATLTATVKGFSWEACSTAFAEAGTIINGISWGGLASALSVVLPFAAIIGGIIYNFQKRREEDKREIIEEQREFVAGEMNWALKACQKASTAMDAWMNAPDDGDKAKLFDKAIKSLRKAIFAIDKIETKYHHLLQDKDNSPKLDVVTRDPEVAAYKWATGKKDIPDMYHHSVHTVRKKTWKLIEEELPNLKNTSSMMQGAVFFFA